MSKLAVRPERSAFSKACYGLHPAVHPEPENLLYYGGIDEGLLGVRVAVRGG